LLELNHKKNKNKNLRKKKVAIVVIILTIANMEKNIVIIVNRAITIIHILNQVINNHLKKKAEEVRQKKYQN